MEFAVIDHLDAASSRPLRPEGIGRLSELANDVHDARPANNQEGVGRITTCCRGLYERSAR